MDELLVAEVSGFYHSDPCHREIPSNPDRVPDFMTSFPVFCHLCLLGKLLVVEISSVSPKCCSASSMHHLEMFHSNEARKHNPVR